MFLFDLKKNVFCIVCSPYSLFVFCSQSDIHVFNLFLLCARIFGKNNVVIQAHYHISNNISKHGTSVLECNCTVHV